MKEYVKWLFGIPGVVAVGRGHEGIVVSVEKKLPPSRLRPEHVIPARIMGESTSVVETGKLWALRTGRHRPAPGGVSIGHYSITAGTLGCLVEKDGLPFILSNNHVLANCFDEGTEVLTKSGWQSWQSVHQDTLFATRAADGGLEYQRPTALVKQQHRGKMLHFKGRWHDLMVTPNHKLLAKKAYRTGMPLHMQSKEGYADYIPLLAVDAFERCQMKSASIEMTSEIQWNCVPLPDFTLPTVEYVKGKDHNRKTPVPIEPWLEFLGLFLGDGSATIRPEVKQYITQIKSTDADRRKSIMELCSVLEFNAFENGDAVRITNKQLTLYLAENIGKTEDKRIPREVFNAPPEQLAFLWKGLMASDDYEGRHGQEGILQKNSLLIDDIQEVALKLGKGAVIRRVDGSPYNPDGIYWSLRTCRTVFRQHEEVGVVDYDGFVYCADVPNGTLMVRRNGKPCWSCNSNNAERGDAILQPGTHDGGDLYDDQIAELHDFVPVKFAVDVDCPVSGAIVQTLNGAARAIGSRARFRMALNDEETNLVDAAIASPLWADDVTAEVLEIGQLAGSARGELGMAVKKSGRTTGFTTGEITQVDVTCQVQYGLGQVAVFEDQLMAGPMSEGGDSGSVVVSDDNQVVGLLFAGSAQVTIFNCIGYVLDAFGVRIA